MENCSPIIFNPSNDHISSCHSSVWWDSKTYIPKGFYVYLKYFRDNDHQHLWQSIIFGVATVIYTYIYELFTSNVIVFVSSSGVQNIQYFPATSRSTAYSNSSQGFVDRETSKIIRIYFSKQLCDWSMKHKYSKYRQFWGEKFSGIYTSAKYQKYFSPRLPLNIFPQNCQYLKYSVTPKQKVDLQILKYNWIETSFLLITLVLTISVRSSKSRSKYNYAWK